MVSLLVCCGDNFRRLIWWQQHSESDLAKNLSRIFVNWSHNVCLWRELESSMAKVEQLFTAWKRYPWLSKSVGHNSNPISKGEGDYLHFVTREALWKTTIEQPVDHGPVQTHNHHWQSEMVLLSLVYWLEMMAVSGSNLFWWCDFVLRPDWNIEFGLDWFPVACVVNLNGHKMWLNVHSNQRWIQRIRNEPELARYWPDSQAPNLASASGQFGSVYLPLIIGFQWNIARKRRGKTDSTL